MKYYYFVVILDAQYSYDIRYIYFSYNKYSLGQMVAVPFGIKNKLKEAVILGNSQKLEKAKEIKYELPRTISSYQIKILGFLSKYYCSPKASFLRLMIPFAKRFVLKKDSFKDRTNTKTIQKIYITTKKEKLIDYLNKQPKSFKARIGLIKDLIHSFPYSLIKKSKYSKLNIEKLEKEGLISTKEESFKSLNIYKDFISSYDELPKLTKEQEDIFLKLYKQKSNNILYGVSGSGKSIIYLHLAMKAIKENKRFLLLLPDMALISYHSELFKKHFGDFIGVYHPRMSQSEIAYELERISNGDFPIVIGTRNALLIQKEPADIIILDEFHDENYISKNPWYDIRRIAKEIPRYKDVNIIFSSATPEVSYFYDKDIKKHYLLERWKKRELEIKCIDMRNEFKRNNFSYISKTLEKKIIENINKKEKTLLLINKAAYSSHIFCRNCGNILKCKNCGYTLRYYKGESNYKCNICKNKEYIKYCDKCSSNSFRHYSGGIEKLEDYIKSKLTTKILSFSAYKMNKKDSYRKMYDDLKNGDYDIVIGTSVISRGFNFDFSLSSCVYADNALYASNYKAAENTYSLLQQFFSRTSHFRKGEGYIQTYLPDNYVFNSVLKDDYISFYKQEIEIRKERRFPPFIKYILIKLLDKNENELEKNSIKIYNNLKDVISKLTLPYKPALYRRGDYYYKYIRIDIRINENEDYIKREIFNLRNKFTNINFYIEVDSINIF